MIDGASVHSCVVLAARCEGKEITTVEGLSPGGELVELQRFFLKHGALQCGYCTPGILMAVEGAAQAQSPAYAGGSKGRIGREPVPLYRIHEYLRGRDGV
jgi:aerobic-type carbon monoxide dehydrogenase small subunit (CoxS/CutS family)